MKKEDIKVILGSSELILENNNGTAFEISVVGSGFDVIFTVPFDVNVLHFEARDKSGKMLLADLHDFYGETEVDDFKDMLNVISEIIRSPCFEITSNGKTVRHGVGETRYLFGEFNG